MSTSKAKAKVVLNTNLNYDAARDTFYNMIKENPRINLTKVEIKNLEIAIFNWSIDFANGRHIIRNWEHSQFRMVYLNKCMTIISNLDNNGYAKNKTLYSRVKSGEISITQLPYLQPNQLNPENWTDIMEAIHKKDKASKTEANISYTDQFKCGRCKQRKTTYYTQQTRSADEPETIFIRCVNCGKQWKC
jgi:DNA-directed RNA polymerase subunit M/transcription elongation factor TFIIS